MVLRPLREIARRADYGALRAAAQQVMEEGTTSLERAVGSVLHAYALLRIDVHQHHEAALQAVADSAPVLTSQRETAPDDADWAFNIAGFCYQVAGDHAAAEVLFRAALDRLEAGSLHRCVALGALGQTLNEQGRRSEARELLRQAGADLDTLPERSPGVSRERERMRLNLVESLLHDGEHAEATVELAQVNDEHLSPMLVVLELICRARLAVMRDAWDDAEQLGHRANAAALDLDYIPFRQDALGVLITCAGRRGRYAEQLQLAEELVALRMPMPAAE